MADAGGELYGRRRRSTDDKRHVGRCLFTESLFELKPNAFGAFCCEAVNIEKHLTRAAEAHRSARRRRVPLSPQQQTRVARALAAWDDDFEQLVSYLDALPKREGELHLNGDPAWFLPLLQFALPRILTASRTGRELTPAEAFRGQWRDQWFDDPILQRDCRWLARTYTDALKPAELAREAGLQTVTVRKAIQRTARLLDLPQPDRRGRPAATPLSRSL